MTKEEMVEAIKQMTVIELSDLVKALEEEFGVSAAAPVAMAAPGAGGAAEEEPEEEQTEFTVVLASFCESKINVIKAVREVTGLGLKDAKELVESAPKPIKESVAKDEAEQTKTKIEEAGGTVEIK